MENFNDLGVGVDIEEIERFKKYDTKNNPFVLRIFTKDEIEYCFENVNFAARLAARYCAKEACLKAVCSFGYEAVSYADFEVYHAKNGAPEVRIVNDLLSEKVELKISLSHSRTSAICYAIAHKKHQNIDYLGTNNTNAFVTGSSIRSDIYGSAEI